MLCENSNSKGFNEVAASVFELSIFSSSHHHIPRQQKRSKKFDVSMFTAKEAHFGHGK